MPEETDVANPTGLANYDEQTQRDILQLRSLIEQCPPDGLVFFGGAGVSTESGIPDFRSPQGLFAKDDSANLESSPGLGGPLDRMPPEQIVSHTFFKSHPHEFFRFYFERMVFPDARPNRAHHTLARLEHAGVCRAVITQNIDGLHQAAGSKNVWELHGSVHRNHCEECRRAFSLEEVLALHAQAADGVPRCTSCDGIVRPDVVLYEEPLDPSVMEGAIDAISKASMLVVAGTSLVVYPAAGLLQYFQGTHLAVVNLQPTPMDRNANLCVAAKIGDVLDF